MSYARTDTKTEVDLRPLRLAILTQAALALYFQAIQWLPLGRWNYQPQNSGLTPFSNVPLLVLAGEGRLTWTSVLWVLVFLVPFASFCIGYWRGWRWLMWLQLPFYCIWMGIQASWWLRYAVGASDSEMDVYQRTFAPATQLLPSFGRHVPPDGAHFVMHLLILLALVLTARGLIKTRPAAKEHT